MEGREELNHNKRNLASSQTTFEAKDLQQHAEYQFWVTASTRVGEGKSSRVVSQISSNRGKWCNSTSYCLKQINYHVSFFHGSVYF